MLLRDCLVDATIQWHSGIEAPQNLIAEGLI